MFFSIENRHFGRNVRYLAGTSLIRGKQLSKSCNFLLWKSAKELKNTGNVSILDKYIKDKIKKIV